MVIKNALSIQFAKTETHLVCIARNDELVTDDGHVSIQPSHEHVTGV